MWGPVGHPRRYQKRTEISYNAAISAYTKGQLWEQALILLLEMFTSQLAPDVIRYNAAISAYKNGHLRGQALSLLLEMLTSQLAPDVISYNSAIRANKEGRL